MTLRFRPLWSYTLSLLNKPNVADAAYATGYRHFTTTVGKQGMTGTIVQDR
jgi:hypothetical protein